MWGPLSICSNWLSAIVMTAVFRLKVLTSVSVLVPVLAFFKTEMNLSEWQGKLSANTDTDSS